MTKTKISPDGSLPRITSSSIGITRHLQIVKVPDDEVKEGGLLYKLIHITANESESESEKSEEEHWSDDDIPSVQLPVENMPNQLSLETKEKAKDVESQTEAETQRGQSEGIKVRRNRNNRNRRFRSSKQGSFNSPKRIFNTSSRSHEKYDKSNTSVSNVEEKNYKYFPNNKEFGSSNNFGRKYNAPRNFESIEVWEKPPDGLRIGVQQHWSPCSTFSYGPPSVIELTPLNNNVDNSLKKGLLGDSPYSDFTSSRQNDFPLNRQSDESPYSAPHQHAFLASRQNDNFISKQEYYNNTEYQEYPPNSYQRRPNRGGRGRGRGRGCGCGCGRGCGRGRRRGHGCGSMSVPSGYKNQYQRNHWHS